MEFHGINFYLSLHSCLSFPSVPSVMSILLGISWYWLPIFLCIVLFVFLQFPSSCQSELEFHGTNFNLSLHSCLGFPVVMSCYHPALLSRLLLILTCCNNVSPLLLPSSCIYKTFYLLVLSYVIYILSIFIMQVLVSIFTLSSLTLQNIGTLLSSVYLSLSHDFKFFTRGMKWSISFKKTSLILTLQKVTVVYIRSRICLFFFLHITYSNFLNIINSLEKKKLDIHEIRLYHYLNFQNLNY